MREPKNPDKLFEKIMAPTERTACTSKRFFFV
jgi:hypothetical protein